MKKILFLFGLSLTVSFLAPLSLSAYDAANGYVDGIVVDLTNTAIYSTFNGTVKVLYLRPDVVGYTQADRMYSQLLAALTKNKMIVISTANSSSTNITNVTTIR